MYNERRPHDAAKRPLLVGNWKMNRTPREAAEHVRQLRPVLDGMPVNVILLPPAVCLPALQSELKGSPIRLGAQNAHEAPEGAFTGELSMQMIRSVGCEYVLLGHSERRTLFGETDDTVARKVRAAVDHRLVPILCVGESREERDAGRALGRVTTQVTTGLSQVRDTEDADLVIAYEPLWAIGSGESPEPSAANETLGAIRDALREGFGSRRASRIPLLYGGSMRAANASRFLAQSEIDGGLVGAATRSAADFIDIARAHSASTTGKAEREHTE